MSASGVLERVPGEAWARRQEVLAVGDRDLYFQEFRRAGIDAEGTGRTLVALHGMSSHGDAWRPIVARLGAVDRVVCPDFRGHGFSSWTREGYWLADYADDTLALADHLGLGQFDLLGHSLGARVSMVLGNLAKDRIRSVVLSDTGPEVSREGALKAQAISATEREASSFRDPSAVRAALVAQHPAWPDDPIDIRTERLYRENWAGRWVHRGDPEVTYLLGRAGLREVDDMWAGLRSTPAPLLLLRGASSFLLDDELTARMRAANPGLEYVELELPHDMLYEDPDTTSAVIDGFLSRH